MTRGTHGGRNLDRWRAGLIVVVSAVLCASAVRHARASFYKASPIVCDGIDDDAGASVLGALPEETTKKSSSTKARPIPAGKISRPAILRPRAAPVETRLPMSSPESPPRFKRLLTLRGGSSDDPAGPH